MSGRQKGYVLAVHGGAGTIAADQMTPTRGALYHAGLRRALAEGRAVLAAGGSALDAVIVAVVALEDDPLFNAGRGSVYTAERTQEMDASIMDGRDRRAGAVGAIFGPRNPVLAARAVMAHSPHVFLVGVGAEGFCRGLGLAFAEADYFASAERLSDLSLIAARGNGRRRRPRPRRQSRRGDLDWRDRRQASRPGRRQRRHRRRRLCR